MRHKMSVLKSLALIAFKKTTGELNEYISQNKISISNAGKGLLQFQANYCSEEKNQAAFSPRF